MSAASKVSTAPVASTGRGGRGGRRRSTAELSRTGMLTAIYLGVLIVFLSPLAYSFLTSIKTEAQMSQANAPILPSDPQSFDWNGKTYAVYYVPMPDGTTRELALIRKGRQDSDFVDPSNPDAGLINWAGSWRALSQPWQTAPHFENYLEVWDVIDFPLHLRNTLILAIVSTIGTVVSCTLVAYGFARFRFPGRAALFTLVLSTIFLPAAVTLIPTYAVFVKLGWVGTYLPLLVPTFFANAYDVFLLRQYLMTIPRDHDEAAMIDGAGSLRILRSVILPQAWPVIVAVAIFTFVYSWNDYFGPLIYLAGHEEMQPLQVALAHFHSIYFSDSTLIQAGNIMTLVIPVILFFMFQRVFIRGIVITGVDK